MVSPEPQERKTALAGAIAQGRSVALWRRDNHVPRSTAYRWARQPEVRATAESSRRRARKCAVGRMARRAYRASYELATLAECAESEPVRLGAAAVDLFRCNCHVQVPNDETCALT